MFCLNYSLSGARALWHNAVAVPKIIFDEHLRMASARQLKALLFMLSKEEENVSEEELALFLGCEAEDVVDIMEYWFANGIVSKDNVKNELKRTAPPAPAQTSNVTKVSLVVDEKTNEKPVTKVLSAPSLSPKDVVARANEDENVSSLLNAAQGVLCRTISLNEQGMLINMIDYYGLKPEIILMILDYARSVGKDNFRYISTIAKNWGDEGIDSIEEAERKLADIASSDSAWKEYCRLAELTYKTPTLKQSQRINKWLKEWEMTMEVVAQAVERAKDAQPSRFTEYVDGILAKWHRLGIKTLADIEEKEINDTKKPQPKRGSKEGITSQASYNVDEIDENSFLETLNFGG